MEKASSAREMMKAYAIYVATFWALLLPVLMSDDSQFGEYVARNWLFALVLLIMPVRSLGLRFWPGQLLAGFVGSISMLVQGYFAYEYHHYQPSGTIQREWLFVSLLFFALVAMLAWLLARSFGARSFQVFAR